MSNSSSTRLLRYCPAVHAGTDIVAIFDRWLSGPCTIAIAMIPVVGTVFGVRFLLKARLNRSFTAALFALCLVDLVLIFCRLVSACIEITGIVILRIKSAHEYKAFAISLQPIGSSMITASTLLVVYISLQRCLVVMRPLRYAKTLQERSSRSTQRRSTNRTDSSSSASFSAHFLLQLPNISCMQNGSIRKILKPYIIPVLIVLISCLLHIHSYYEFSAVKCWDREHCQESWRVAYHSTASPRPIRRVLQNLLTRHLGPAIVITISTILTEIKVQESLNERKRLFESQPRRRSILLTEDLKEKVSRTVSIFIAVKFLMLRTLPIVFDIWNLIDGLKTYWRIMDIIIPIAPFLTTLNSATNTLAYFWMKRWMEKLLRLRIVRQLEKRALHTSKEIR
ncbi:unnamed protein product, partial [Mesorhabditis spiculigera]